MHFGVREHPGRCDNLDYDNDNDNDNEDDNEDDSKGNPNMEIFNLLVSLSFTHISKKTFSHGDTEAQRRIVFLLRVSESP
ncbi:hypothetical protein [Candidatus Thiodictyon syntrophicum]|jgi:hypothetical protein|uniref:Uncharacterized protein n=1 Tax=Candidatus Thiodictyon syntrophicum TaxID=1166950 RepID=A0A2K8U2U7_9GAMM|nr:hypothetical protein [Candidatus Thiodictyon syntrophicum]AUB79739.1 hypothetical protein THSYN_01380 [Candidatus Thiodictyon syntrophicum]